MSGPFRKARALNGASAAPAQGSLSRVVVERLMAALVLASLVGVVFQFLARGLLPHPFNADPSESLMDFYNTAFWAHHAGAYSVWHTVYPPLSFVFARVLTKSGCYGLTPYAARTCDPAAAWAMGAFYLANIGLVFLAFRRTNAKVAAPRTLALCLGLPMLYGLELANLIIPCFTVFVLAEGGLLRSRWARRLCLALSFNFKPYLLVLVVPRLLRARLGWLVGVGAASLTIYLITFALERSGSPRQLITDIVFYARGQSGVYAGVNHLSAIAAKSGNLWELTIPPVLRFGQFVALGGLLLGALSKRPVRGQRLATLALSFVCSEAAIHTQGFSADYTLIFMIFVLFMESEDSLLALSISMFAYLLCISTDVALLHADTVSRVGFYSGRLTQVSFDLSLGQFVRPILLIFIQIGLTGLIWRESVIGASPRRAASEALAS